MLFCTNSIIIMFVMSKEVSSSYLTAHQHMKHHSVPLCFIQSKLHMN